MDDAALGRNSDDAARIDGARTMDDATLGQLCARTTLRSDNVRIDGARTMDDSSLRGDGNARNQMLQLAITENFGAVVV